MREGPLRILFVCYGNICRSPIAVGIARALYDGAVQAESAGIAPVGDRPSEESVLVIRTLYNQDILDHKPRQVAAAGPGEYDFVIAMDLDVYERLKASGAVPEDKLYAWDVADPIGRGIEAYFAAADKIRDRLDQFLANRSLGGGRR
ncbi:MAG: low molecular weight phosphatase family protein [Candidatus Aminicenantes bacterium]|nr:low molecular weight phosphatase family protein [Candidatus Aminicenantes bacterium]